MCGIAGIVAKDFPVDPQTIERMCATTAHRGPDSRGLFVREGEHSAQPLHTRPPSSSVSNRRTLAI
jgi:asparagine synthetase B (glutamine-hydrolysing)